MRVQQRLIFAVLIATAVAFISGCGCGGGGETGEILPPPITLVSIEVTPADPSIGVGAAQQFTATGTFSDNTKQDLTASVLWSSSETSIATISNEQTSKGIATGIGQGKTIITAEAGGLSGSTTLTVTGASLVSIEVTPSDPSIAIGATQQFTATGTYSDNTKKNVTTSVVWSSSNTGVATIDNATGAQGLAHGVSAGSTRITAALGDISGSTGLTVTAAVKLVAITVLPPSPIVGFGDKVQFQAIGTYSDNSTRDITTSADWSSSNTKVATISNEPGSKGLATADHVAGITVITATLDGISGSAMLIDP